MFRKQNSLRGRHTILRSEMPTRLTRHCTYALVMLSLLLASLLPTAKPAHAGFPEEDTGIYGAQNTGQDGRAASPSVREDHAPAQVGMDEDAYPGKRPKQWWWKPISWWDAPWKGYLDDPVSTSVGEYYLDKPLLDLGGPLPIQFTLYYVSRIEKVPGIHNDPFGGDAFTHNYHISLWREDDTTVAVLYTGGNLVVFQKNGEWQVLNEEVIYQLEEDDGYYYMMDPILERVYTFEKATVAFQDVGVLTRIEDRNGNALVLTNDVQEFHALLTRVEDGLGRSLDFLGDYPHLASVTDHAGRTIQFEYDVFTGEVQAVHLKSVTDALGMKTTFSYAGPLNNNVIASQILPRGNVPYAQTYEQAPDGWNWRAVSQADAYGNTTSLSFDDDSGVTTITDPLGNTYQHTHQDERLLTAWTDEMGNTATFGYDAQGRRASITDRLGDVTEIAYHDESGKIASYTNAEGNTTTYTYIAQTQTFTNPDNAETVTFTFYDLTGVDYADGMHGDLAYNDYGNVITYTDGMSNTWTYAYNDRGQILTASNPEGGVETYAYNADGTLASSTDSDVGVTTYQYDAYKRLSTITRPGGSTVDFTYDLNDQLLTVNDELGQTSTFTYDANGNLDTAANPLNQTYTYAHDLMDRVASITDPVGQVGNLSYDELGRLKTVTDRNDHTTAYAYNARGWLTGVTDPLDNTWTTAYDAEGVPTAFTTPLGFTTEFQTDKLGRTTVITDPLGQVTNLSYDELGRLTSFADRMERTTDYDYDDAGRLVDVTKPVIGAATYTRNDLGRLTRITDPRGAHWDFGYSDMGRRTSRTDPLGNQWTYTYDTRGRIAQVTYPGGLGTATITYDDANQVTQIAYPGGPALDYAYDDAGRLLTADNLALTYDERGDVTNSQDGAASFGATYDSGRRLETVTYDGLATAIYTYDERGLLTRVEDDLSGAWMTFTYDGDGRLTVISRSNAVDTYFIYDSAGRMTRIEDVGPDDGWPPVADQQYTLNAEGEPTQVLCTLPLDPVPSVPDLSLTYDDAGQISSPGYAYDPRGRQTAAPGKTFTYDSASRLIAINLTSNLQSPASNVQLTYNGLGDLRTRIVDGTTTAYYHNYALSLSPIVAESESPTSNVQPPASNFQLRTSNQYKRFYVYTPGGSLLYSIDPASREMRFYHFDRVGSTLFLTDEGGAVTDAYAYDPYGNLLGHTGASDQPFTYVGRYGVRREPVGGLYDMRARTYDPAAARFLTRDPVWPVPADPESLNPYQYAYQSPLRYVDPRGLQTRLTGFQVQGLSGASAVVTVDWYGDTATHIPALADLADRPFAPCLAYVPFDLWERYGPPIPPWEEYLPISVPEPALPILPCETHPFLPVPEAMEAPVPIGVVINIYGGDAIYGEYASNREMPGKQLGNERGYGLRTIAATAEIAARIEEGCRVPPLETLLARQILREQQLWEIEEASDYGSLVWFQICVFGTYGACGVVAWASLLF